MTGLQSTGRFTETQRHNNLSGGHTLMGSSSGFGSQAREHGRDGWQEFENRSDSAKECAEGGFVNFSGCRGNEGGHGG